MSPKLNVTTGGVGCVLCLPTLRCIYPIFSPCLVLHYKKGPAHSFAEMKTLKTLQIAFAKSLQSSEPQFIAPATCGGAAPGINHLPAAPGLSQGEVKLQQNRTCRSRVPPSPWALPGPILFPTLHVYTQSAALQ